MAGRKQRRKGVPRRRYEMQSIPQVNLSANNRELLNRLARSNPSPPKFSPGTMKLLKQMPLEPKLRNPSHSGKRRSSPIPQRYQRSPPSYHSGPPNVRTSNVPQEAKDKYCGMFQKTLMSRRLQPMSLGSHAFQLHLHERMHDLVNPLVKLYRQYAELHELSCKEPRLRGVCAPHQIIVQEIARLFATTTPQQLDGHRGLLAWHSTGSGKMLLVAAIMVAFYGTHHNVVFTTTFENKASNSPEKYACVLLQYFPGFIRRVFGRPMSVNQQNMHLVRERLFDINAGSKKPFVITTLNEFDNNVATGMGAQLYSKYQALHAKIAQRQQPGGAFERGTCLIIDEVQNVWQWKHVAQALMSPELVAGQPTVMPFGSRPVKVFALTATPGDTVEGFLKTLSLVRRTDQLAPFTSPEPMSQFAGLVSYINYTHPARFATVVGPTNYKVELPGIYYAVLLNKWAALKDQRQNNKETYLKLVKQSGNFISKTDAGTLWPQLRAHRQLERVTLQGGREVIASSKLVKIANKVVAMDGKQYVYLQTKASSDAFCALLKKRGFSQVSVRRGRQSRRRAESQQCGEEKKDRQTRYQTVPAKRFIQYHKRSDDPVGIYAAYRDIMNNPSNLHGETCKVIVCHGKHYEGLDISAVRAVHLVEPLYSALADKQAVGRGSRQCGHVGLRGRELKLYVYRYFAAPPKQQPMPYSAMFGHGRDRRLYKRYEKALALHNNIQTRARVFHELSARQPFTPKGPDYLAYARALMTPRQKQLLEFENRLKRYAVDRILLNREFGSGAGYSPYKQQQSVVVLASRSPPRSRHPSREKEKPRAKKAVKRKSLSQDAQRASRGSLQSNARGASRPPARPSSQYARGNSAARRTTVSNARKI